MTRRLSVAIPHVRRLTRPGTRWQYPHRRMCAGPHGAGSPIARNVDELIPHARERDTVAAVLSSHAPAPERRLAGGLA